jgi:hypothetical protein
MCRAGCRIHGPFGGPGPSGSGRFGVWCSPSRSSFSRSTGRWPLGVDVPCGTGYNVRAVVPHQGGGNCSFGGTVTGLSRRGEPLFGEASGGFAPPIPHTPGSCRSHDPVRSRAAGLSTCGWAPGRFSSERRLRRWPRPSVDGSQDAPGGLPHGRAGRGLSLAGSQIRQAW